MQSVLPYTQSDYQAHFEQMHQKFEEKKKFQCSQSATSEQTKSNGFKEHLSQMHGAKDKPCPKCQNFFGSARCLRKHMKSHEGPKLCQYCNVKFAKLREHYKGKESAKIDSRF